MSRSVLGIFRNLMVLAATVEVYVLVTYAFRNKTSRATAKHTLTTFKWLFVGRPAATSVDAPRLPARPARAGPEALDAAGHDHLGGLREPAD